MNKLLEKELIKDIGENRYRHSIRVMETAVILADIYNADIEKTRIAAILHDCGKLTLETNQLKRAYDSGIILDTCMEFNLELIHGPLGAKIAKEKYGIKDIEVLEAIYYHTTGRENMNILDKIIYISDYIEPKRNFPGVEVVRKMAFEDIDHSIIHAMENTIGFLIRNNKLIHPDTIKARNHLMIQSNFN